MSRCRSEICASRRQPAEAAAGSAEAASWTDLDLEAAGEAIEHSRSVLASQRVLRFAEGTMEERRLALRWPLG